MSILDELLSGTQKDLFIQAVEALSDRGVISQSFGVAIKGFNLADAIGDPGLWYRGYLTARRADNPDLVSAAQDEILTLEGHIADLKFELRLQIIVELNERIPYENRTEETAQANYAAAQAAVDQMFDPILSDLKAIRTGLGTGVVADMLFDWECFIEGTKIAVWDGVDNVSAREPKSFKHIEDIVEGDHVLSYDEDGMLRRGVVERIFVKRVKVILDFWGTGVTPGHAYLCSDGPAKGKHIVLIDVLRQDSAVMRADGSLMRASTGADVDGPLDQFVQAVTGEVSDDGEFVVREAKMLRAGTRILLSDGRDLCLADIITEAGGTVGEDGLIVTDDCPEGMPFHWTFSETLPNPEDYILQRSGTSLEDIYKAAEWDHHRPTMPAPMAFDGVPVEKAAPRQRHEMPRNEPLYMDQLEAKANRTLN